MKYIFIAGAPGSKWSSVCKNIYYSPSINKSDYSDARTYWHDASGKMDLMHLGVYFDPGMEFDLPEHLDVFSKEVLEKIFDSAFDKDSTGVRIIKSHIFCNHIDFIKETWPDCPIVLVHRDDDACLGWWVKCGHFDITYPRYDKYYKDLRTMAGIIADQNADILNAWEYYDGILVNNNRQLADYLGLDLPPTEYQQDYKIADIKVKII
jgi:hypothetical protein